MSGMFRRRKGFTLVELLVVMAIIGILAAIILPSLAKARARAKMVSCISGLRQVGQGFLEYANDFQMHLPDWGTVGGGESSQEMCWHAHLFVYGYLDSEEVFACPGDERAMAAWAERERGNPNAKQGVPNRPWRLEQPNICSYGAWPGMSSWDLEHGGNAKHDHSPIGRPGDESLMLLYEAGMCFSFDVALAQAAWQWSDPPDYDEQRADARHPGQTFYSDGDIRPGTFNILWLDGHVTNSTTRRLMGVFDIVRNYDVE